VPGLRRAKGPSRRVPRVALATCRELPTGDEDAAALLAACTAAGLDAEWRIWDDPAIEWGSYDLVVVRSTWDYVPRRDDFTGWATAVPRLANPADLIAWSTDKSYLRELAAAGVPVVPTAWFTPPPNGTGDWPSWPDLVVKPTVSAGAQDTARYGADELDRARAHAGRLLAAGRPVMVQPYLAGVDTEGEAALVFVGGAYSHTLRKGAVLRPGDAAETDELYRSEEITEREPTAAERELAERALAAVPGGAGRLLYARVDLLPGPDGGPVVVEIELAEPSLFLWAAPGSAERFAAAIRAALP
jgi:hypothetical protein